MHQCRSLAASTTPAAQALRGKPAQSVAADLRKGRTEGEGSTADGSMYHRMVVHIPQPAEGQITGNRSARPPLIRFLRVIRPQASVSAANSSRATQ